MAENTEEASQQQAQKTLMVYQDQNQQWILHEYYVAMFNNFTSINIFLFDNPNQEWNQNDYNVYCAYINTITTYINQVLCSQIYYLEDYYAWLDYAGQQNPRGRELFDKQRRFFKNQQDKEEKKNKKKEKPVQKVEVKKEVPKQEPVVVRAGDPEINIPKLFSTKWDLDKYVSTDLLRKDNVNIVFIGHVDSGKSTLTGNIIKELKEIDEQELANNMKELKQNKMEAWGNASVSDVIPEEREDGKTRQYAKLNFFLEKKRFTLFDAPGHKNYVPNMIMGACQADVAVLIISAKDGEFESGFDKDGQTKEHAMLAKALGVIELIVVVTKMGTVNWNKKRFDQIQEQVTPFLENSCGFHNVKFIPLESVSNQNVHTKYDVQWYKGPCFIDYLDNLVLPERKPMGPLRIPVIDKFKDMGKLYVYGKVQSGSIIQDHTVTILPNRQKMVIREIFNAKDQRMPFACAGENVKMLVKNIDEEDISRGDMVCNNLNYCQESAELKANITILELPEEKKLLSSGYECILHMHAIAAQVQISVVQGRIDKESKKMVKSTFLKAGQKGVCQIKIERPICLEKYDFMPGLGRFTLRDEGKTIGYGEIVGIKPAKKLYDEQKEHLLNRADKKEETKTVGSNNEDKKVEEVVEKVEKVSISESKS